MTSRRNARSRRGPGRRRPAAGARLLTGVTSAATAAVLGFCMANQPAANQAASGASGPVPPTSGTAPGPGAPTSTSTSGVAAPPAPVAPAPAVVPSTWAASSAPAVPTPPVTSSHAS